MLTTVFVRSKDNFQTFFFFFLFASKMFTLNLQNTRALTALKTGGGSLNTTAPIHVNVTLYSNALVDALKMESSCSLFPLFLLHVWGGGVFVFEHLGITKTGVFQHPGILITSVVGGILSF